MESLPLLVVIISESASFHEFARAIAGPAAVVQTAGEAGSDVDLFIVDGQREEADTLRELRRRAPSAAVLTLSSDARAAYFLRCRLPGRRLAGMTYREVLDAAGAETIRDYLRALLTRHHGNVTKAALAARLERESLHRLMRRHGLSAGEFRKPSA